jgi:hypothetical protein
MPPPRIFLTMPPPRIFLTAPPLPFSINFGASTATLFILGASTATLFILGALTATLFFFTLAFFSRFHRHFLVSYIADF